MSVFAIKLIALVCMLIDHIGYVFSRYTPNYLRWIGRIAFPIYVYLISEGCKYTKNINKFTLRLGLFALISEIPFDLAFNQTLGNAYSFIPKISFIQSTNVFFTLFLGVACVNVYMRLKEKNLNEIIARISAIPIILLAGFLQTDYGMFGVAWIFLMYLAGDKNKKLIVMLLGVVYQYGLPLIQSHNFMNRVPYLVFGLISVLLVFFYNGKRGKNIRWAFYWFYPVHLSILAAIWLLFFMPKL